MTQLAIYAFEQAELPVLNDVLMRIAQHQHVAVTEVFVRPRASDGWLEYLAVLRYEDGSKLTIGCIQRGLNQPTEFHT